MPTLSFHEHVERVDKVTNPLPFTFVVSETVAEFETHGNICILANYYFLP